MEVACKGTDPRGGMTENIALTKTFIAATEGQAPATFTLEDVCVVGVGVREQGTGKGLVDVAWAPSFTLGGL